MGQRGGLDVPTVAVVLHKKKVRDKDRRRVRAALRAAGVDAPLWYEVPKSRKARKKARRAAREGADVVIAWGGDGTVQRCVDALAGRDVDLAIIPAGTSNLLASALRVPDSPKDAVRVALDGATRVLDTGTVNGEHFAVVAGAGMDALLVRDAGSGLKDKIGRAAYVYTGVKHAGFDAFDVDVEVDGERVFRGKSTSVLIGNVPGGVGGLEVFDSSDPDDGVLEVGVVTAEGPLQMVRAVARTVLGRAEDSPFLRTSSGHDVVLQFGRPVPYEVDGGDRKPTRMLEIEAHPRSIRVRVPHSDTADPTG
ncbi:sphingosine kinase [Actinotalea ferrariae CF5-4]|uniref:Sphingosine kinase n=1 Tax=Actinotalea ferrariae CF5-4 TaxID=948458 RepID=A0A021VY71_9CELL|nr:diacylglycerol kinase family protein [Actinotalea ferrariae]EYR64950.1 sphingosine kinase [Actinotalea ferrariae CF5-4]